MTKISKKQFKKELKSLLEKYNADIVFDVSEESDTQGIYDERFIVQFNDDTSIILSNGWYISKTDL